MYHINHYTSKRRWADVKISEEKKKDLRIVATTFIGTIVCSFLPMPYWILSPAFLFITVGVLVMVLLPED
jgi:hypothetical protein